MSSLECGAERKCLLYSMYIVSNACYDMLGAFLRNSNMDYKRSGHNSSWSKTAQVVKRKLEGSLYSKYLETTWIQVSVYIVAIYTYFHTFYTIIINNDELKTPYEYFLSANACKFLYKFVVTRLLVM
jgi:tRNA U34 2-thiouridine synthase MnmA/TrmU